MQPKELSLIHSVMVVAYFIIHCHCKETVLKLRNRGGNQSGQPDLDIWNSPICGTRSSNSSGTTGRNESTSENTSEEKWPWVAGIYYKNPSEKDQLIQAGFASIITDRHLLTVACILTRNASNVSSSDLSDIVILVGSEYQNKGYFHFIQKVITQPIKQGDNLCKGLAVVKLVNSMTFSDTIKPICLPSKSDKYFNFQGQSLPVIGWIISSGNSSETLVMKKFDILVQPKEFCQQYIRGTYPIDKLSCGWMKSKDLKHVSCSMFGNGAPVMMNENGKFTAVGLFDFGIGKKLPCGSPKVPIYFINVAPFMSWIAEAVYKSMLD